jgi:hypothetical protein
MHYEFCMWEDHSLERCRQENAGSIRTLQKCVRALRMDDFCREAYPDAGYK